MSISERIRPGVEAAPWLCEEVGKLEVSYEALKIQNDRLLEALKWARQYVPSGSLAQQRIAELVPNA